MKCIILLVIFAMAQHEGVTGLPQPDVPRCAEQKCEELYKLVEDSVDSKTIYGRRLYRDNLLTTYVKCKWDRLESSFQYFKHKFEQFVHDLRHGFLPENIASHNTTQTNVTSTVSTPTNNHQPTPVKIDEKAKPEDNKDQLTSQNPASSEKTQEKETQTSFTPDESTVKNQTSTPLDLV